MKSKNEKSFLGKKHAIRVKIKKINNLSKFKKLYSIKGPWTYHEDLLLKKWVETHGPKNWRLCAKNIPGRNQSQCRQHWNNKLKPNLLIGNWTSEEIFLIVAFYKKLNGSWKKIIPIFKSRTENSIKNIFFSQTRAIVSKMKYEKENNKKVFDLPTLLKYYDIVYDETKKKFLEDNPMSNNELEEYIKNIEKMLENKPKGKKHIDLDILREKYNIKVINESFDDKSSKKENKINKKIIPIKKEKNKEEQKTEEIINIFKKENVSHTKKEIDENLENNKSNNISCNQINNENKFMDNLLNNIISNENNNNNFNQINNINNCFSSIINYYINYYSIINRLLLDINYNIYKYNIINRLLSYRNNNIDYNNLLCNLITNIIYTNNNMNSNNINNSFSLNNNNEKNNINNNNNINQINEDNFNNSVSEKPGDFSENLKSNENELPKNIYDKDS